MLYLRALVLHPLLCVGPWVAACWVLARLPGSTLNHVVWGLYVVPAGAIGSFGWTVTVVTRAELPGWRKAMVVVLGLAASAAAGAAGLVLWFLSAKVACHGGYECPI